MPAPLDLTAFSAVAAPADEYIDIAWTFNTGGTPAINAQLTLSSGAVLITTWDVARVEGTSFRLPASPGSYVVTCAPTNNNAGTQAFGTTVTSGTITVPTRPFEVAVTTDPAAQPTVRGIANGFLHGLDSWRPGGGVSQYGTQVTDLKPHSWRIWGDLPGEAWCRSKNIETQHIFGDYWWQNQHNGTYTYTPWPGSLTPDWTRFESYVATIVNSAVAGNWVPTYWDIWNEPANQFLHGWAPADLASAKVWANWCEMFVRAYNVIKGIDPTMKCVAYSGTYGQARPSFPWFTQNELDLDTFLAYSQSHGVVWDAISWHDNERQVGSSDPFKFVANVDLHIKYMQDCMARYPGTVVGNRIIINEYTDPEVHLLAADTVCYFRAFEDANIYRANRGNWSEPEFNHLNGLLIGDPPTGSPTAAYWTHKFYAEMEGQTRVDLTSNSSWQFSGLATRDDATKTLRALFGRHRRCAAGVNSWCTSQAALPTVPLTVTLDWPYGTGDTELIVRRLPAGISTLAAPPVVSSTQVVPTNGQLTFTVPDAADGDAFWVTASSFATAPSGTGGLQITSTFSEPFFTGGAVVSQVPSIYEVAVDGHGYFLDLQSGGFKHASIPLIRQQADQADEPGETSLNPEDLWRRSVDTWHLGAGQTYLDASDSDRGRFRTSKGIDPWTQGQITLLPDTVQKVVSGNDVMQLVVAGPYLYLLDGDTLQQTLDIGAASFTNVTGTGFINARGIASDGYNIWIVDDVDLYYTNRGTPTYTTWLQAGTTLAGSLVRYVKGRLFVASGLDVFNPGAQNTALPAAFYTHPNPDWTWVDIAEGPNAIYLGGYSGDKSIIYRTSFDATLADLDTPTVAATLPDGEIIRSLQGYLGFVLVGTDKGLRFAVPGTGGDLELGDLVRVPAVRCFEPQDRFVWFGWTNFDGDSTGLGRIDLRSLNGTQPAYASDLMADTQGITTSVVTFQDRRVFTVAGSGTWAESDDKVVSGTIESGLIGFRLSSSKTALFLETQHRKGEGSYQAAVAVDESSFTNVGTAAATSRSQAGLETVSTGQLVGELFELRFTLNRSLLDTRDAPVIGRATLRADPQAPRRYKIQVPILLAEQVEGQPFDIAAERQHIKELAQSRRPVSYQEGITSFTVIVEDFEWIPYGRTGAYHYDYSGTLNVMLKTVS